MTTVKVCGIKRPEDALVAVEAGADMLGLVFYPPSHRYVTLEQAKEIVAAVKQVSEIPVAGVFVDASPQEMNQAISFCGLDYIQLSGAEPEETASLLNAPVIRTIHMEEDLDAGLLRQRITDTSAEIILLDTARPGSYGGTGASFDWSRVPTLDRPVLLAGGLHSGNVAEAVRTTGVWGVDVSSGVETGREKDHRKIREFVSSVRRS